MHTFLIAAQSLDGFIAQASDQISTSWTSREDKRFLTRRTKAAKLMVMGSTTFLTFKRLLPERAMIIYTRDVEKFRQTLAAQEINIEVVELSAADQSDLRQDVLYVTALPPNELVKFLDARGVPEMALCGGASVYTQFLTASCIDTLYVIVESVVFGKGVKLFDEFLTTKLQLVTAEQLSDQTLLLEYRVDHR